MVLEFRKPIFVLELWSWNLEKELVFELWYWNLENRIILSASRIPLGRLSKLSDQTRNPKP